MPLQITASGAANLAASQIIQQANGFFAQVSGSLYNGIPARGTIPAVAATDLQDALGSANLSQILAAISGFNS
jgi:hypothetical protein